jgi:hypothetical protein
MAPGGIGKQSGEQAKTPLKLFFNPSLSPYTKQGIAMRISPESVCRDLEEV